MVGELPLLLLLLLFLPELYVIHYVDCRTAPRERGPLLGVLANCFENCLRAACSAHSPTPTLLKVMTEKLSLFQRQKLAAEALQSKSAKAAAEGGLVENQEEEEDEEMWAKSRGLPAETWPLFCLPAHCF